MYSWMIDHWTPTHPQVTDITADHHSTNPSGNAYRTQQTALTRPCALDAAPSLNRTIKILNKKKRNPISGRVEGYKLLPAATQLMLADEASVQARRARFAKVGARSISLWVPGT